MTDYFVWNGSAQDDSDAFWNSSTLAYLDLDTCLAAVAAGSSVFVAHDHTKDYAADVVFNNNGTPANPIIVQCVNRTTGALAQTAVEEATGGANTLDIYENNVIYDGMIFRTGESSTANPDTTIILRNSRYEFLTIADTLSIRTGDIDLLWENVVFDTYQSANYLRIGGGCHIKWIGGSIVASAVAPTSPIRFDTGDGSTLLCIGVDFTVATSSVITLGSIMALGLHHIKLIGCKLPNGVPILNSSTFSVPHEVIARSCDNGDGFYFFEETYLEGQIVQDTANYLNATYDGSNGYSAKMATNANALDQKRPLRFMLAEFYSAANPTLTVEMITAGVTLQDDKCWLEIEYPNSTDEAVRDIDKTSFQSVGWANGSGPGTPSNLTASTEAWTEVLASEVKQKIAVTISGGAAGQHRVFVCLAKPSTTGYVDPKVTIS